MGDFNFETFSHIVKEYNLHSCVHCQEFIIDITEMDIRRSEMSSKEVKAACENGCIFLQTFSRMAGTEYKSIAMRVENDRDCMLILVSYGQGPWFDMEIKHVGLEHDELGCDSKPMQGDRLLAIHPCINDNSCFRKIRNMLQECRKHHQGCQRISRAPPPRRLIDVWHKMNDVVRVVDGELIDNPSWAALSYCWGEGGQSGRTTNNNIKERQIQLAICELPLTIRDAINVCRQLNIQYLWVDSICILQDNARDKLEEIAKMTGIYQDAIITISASCASSADRGFLEARTPYPPGVALPVRRSKGYAVAQLIGRGYAPPLEPIDLRGWVFQERMLSTRFLSFKTNAVVWKCSQSHCNFDKHGRYSNREDLTLNHIIYGNDRWKALVGGYSGRRLSYLKDRPVAFAGVAEAYCQANSLKPNDYLAGLWRPTLLKDLLWVSNDLHDLHPSKGWLLPVGNSTEDPYIAPSWSWISALYPVCWFLRNLVETAEVVSIQIELLQPDLKFGALKSGRVRLRGRLHHDKHSIDWSGDVTREYKHESDSHYHRREIVDSDLIDLEGEHVWFFEIGVFQVISTDQHRVVCKEDLFHEKDPLHEKDFSQEESPHQHTDPSGELTGLMLLSTGKEKEFTRVGVYKEDLGGVSYDDFFGCFSEKSCKWCELNKERKLTDIEIV